MRTLTVHLGERSYPIHITPGILDQAGARTWNMSGGYRFYEMKVRDEQSQAAGMGLCTACGMEKAALWK